MIFNTSSFISSGSEENWWWKNTSCKYRDSTPILCDRLWLYLIIQRQGSPQLHIATNKWIKELKKESFHHEDTLRHLTGAIRQYSTHDQHSTTPQPHLEIGSLLSILQLHQIPKPHYSYCRQSHHHIEEHSLKYVPNLEITRLVRSNLLL